MAVVSDSLLIAALTPNTIANSAITNPQRRILLEYRAVKIPGLVATPYAVALQQVLHLRKLQIYSTKLSLQNLLNKVMQKSLLLQSLVKQLQYLWTKNQKLLLKTQHQLRLMFQLNKYLNIKKYPNPVSKVGIYF